MLVTCALAPGLACKRSVGAPTPDLEFVGDVAPWRDGETLHVVAARGETVGFQIRHKAPGNVTVALPSLHSAIQSFALEPLRARRGSTALYGSTRGAGVYPEVLVSSPSPDYVSISIPVDAAPASHDGTITVGDRSIPLRVDITSVALPPLTPRVWAYYDPRELVWARLGTGTHDAPSKEERACIATFRNYGILLSPDLPISAWPARRDLLGGFPYVPVKLTKDRELVDDEVRQWIDATRGTGQLPFSIPIDEPRTKDARANVRALASIVRGAGGGPSTFLYAVTDEPRAEYDGLVDLFITLAPKRADTHTRWTYNGAPPRAGGLVLDALPPGPRTWGWLAWRWNIPVWYVWDALYWHDRHNRKGAPLPGRALDAAVDAVSFDDGEDHGNLDGVLALPGDTATPCRPTLRMAAIRRGMQDRLLLEKAAACDPVTTAAVVDELIPRALGDAPSKGRPAWSTDPAVWEAARQRVMSIARCGERAL